MSEMEPQALTRRELREREAAAAAAASRAPRSSRRANAPTQVPEVPVAPAAARLADEPQIPAAQIPTVAPVAIDERDFAPLNPPTAPIATSTSRSSARRSASQSTPSAKRPPRRADTGRTRRSAPDARPTAAPGALRKRTASRLVSFGALLGAGALLVSLSVPANLFLVESSTAMMAADAPADVQGQVLPATESVQAAAPVERGAWDVATPAELRSASMIRVDTSYTVNNDGAVRWPFPVAVPISDGYGARVSPCSGCSSQHKGTDFTPGVGSPIAAIADGVVSVKQDSAWGFGYHVMIDHVVDGQKVTSLYAHMISGSSELQVGDVVTKGDFVGEVGTTGASTGPHLHFEIRLDGVQVNPFLWLQAHTN